MSERAPAVSIHSARETHLRGGLNRLAVWRTGKQSVSMKQHNSVQRKRTVIFALALSSLRTVALARKHTSEQACWQLKTVRLLARTLCSNLDSERLKCCSRGAVAGGAAPTRRRRNYGHRLRVFQGA